MRAVVSLGTNTVRLLMVRDEAYGAVTQLEHRQTGTRLGEGLRDDGPLAPAAVARTLAAVAEFAACARDAGAREIACIATSAVRRAADREAFAERLLEASGLTLRVLSGTEEAEASFRGATQAMPHDGKRVAVLDIGGGSTECAAGCDGVVEDARSIEIGSVRLTETFPDLAGAAPGAPARAAAARAREFLRAKLASLAELRPVDTLVCVAGTPLTLAAVAFASHVTKVDGDILDAATVEATGDRLLGLTLEARRALPGMLPQRADVLAGGSLILREAYAALGVERAILESNDLLLGVLLAG